MIKSYFRYVNNGMHRYVLGVPYAVVSVSGRLNRYENRITKSELPRCVHNPVAVVYGTVMDIKHEVKNYTKWLGKGT